MTVSDIKEKLEAKLCCGAEGLTKNVKGCYIGDLLSLAMAKVSSENIWITIQTNINIIAVSSLTDAACIILPEGLVPDEQTINKADTEGIPVLSSEKDAYSIAKELAALGI